jgi:hypothetical protein
MGRFIRGTLGFCDKCEGEMKTFGGINHVLNCLNTGSQLPVLLVLALLSRLITAVIFFFTSCYITPRVCVLRSLCSCL